MSWLRYRIAADYAVGIFENGQEMTFDVSDLELVSAHEWHIDSLGYPRTCVDGFAIRLHRLLILNIPDGMVIDHINRDKLDNRRSNLRVVTSSVNALNTAPKKNNTSGVPGVFFDKRAKRWRAQVYKGRKTIHVGIFDSFADAVAARKEAEQKVYGGVYHL